MNKINKTLTALLLAGALGAGECSKSNNPISLENSINKSGKQEQSTDSNSIGSYSREENKYKALFSLGYITAELGRYAFDKKFYDLYLDQLPTLKQNFKDEKIKEAINDMLLNYVEPNEEKTLASFKFYQDKRKEIQNILSGKDKLDFSHGCLLSDLYIDICNGNSIKEYKPILENFSIYLRATSNPTADNINNIISKIDGEGLEWAKAMEKEIDKIKDFYRDTSPEVNNEIDKIKKQIY